MGWGWLRLRCDETVSAEVQPGVLSIICDAPRQIRFEIDSGTISRDAVQGGKWRFPGVLVTCDVDAVEPTVTLDGNRLTVTVNAAAGRFDLHFVRLD